MAGRILTNDDDVAALVRSFHRVAVLGIKTGAEAGQPAIEVPRYLQSQSIEIVPVPVYFPAVTHILGAPVFRRLQDVPGPLDCVDVFRRAKDLWPHLDDLKAARPRSVWLQLGIRDDAFARALAEAGIDVVQDRCLLVEHRRMTTNIEP
jgi:predicted CoA-binding protein